MQELAPGTWKIGFLVENYVYSLIPRSKLANPGQNAMKFIFTLFFKIQSWGYFLEARQMAIEQLFY